jgi:hypothetical protein
MTHLKIRDKSNSKGLPRQAEVALGVPGRLTPRIFSTFGTTRLVGRQPNAPAAFTPGETPGTHFQRLSRPQGTWFRRKEPRKESQVTPPGIVPGTVRLVGTDYCKIFGIPQSETRKANTLVLHFTLL